MNTTDDLMEKLRQEVPDERALNEYLEKVSEYGNVSSETFSEYYRRLISEKGITSGDVERKTGLEHSFCNKMINGKTRVTRNNMLALALAAGLELDEVEKCLKLTGNGALYPKDSRDAVIIYAINRGLSLADANKLLYSKNMELLGIGDKGTGTLSPN